MLTSFITFIQLKKEKYAEARKIKKMDYWYHHSFQSCFDPYPPSFYYLHTPEEAERIKKENYEKVLKLIEELDD